MGNTCKPMAVSFQSMTKFTTNKKRKEKKKKIFIEFVAMLLLFHVLLFFGPEACDSSSLIRDRTHTPCIEKWSLNHWTAMEVPDVALDSCILYKHLEVHEHSYIPHTHQLDILLFLSKIQKVTEPRVL